MKLLKTLNTKLLSLLLIWHCLDFRLSPCINFSWFIFFRGLNRLCPLTVPAFFLLLHSDHLYKDTMGDISQNGPISLFLTSCLVWDVFRFWRKKALIFFSFYPCETLAVPLGVWALQPAAKSQRPQFRAWSQTEGLCHQYQFVAIGLWRLHSCTRLSLDNAFGISFDLTCQFSIHRCQEQFFFLFFRLWVSCHDF